MVAFGEIITPAPDGSPASTAATEGDGRDNVRRKLALELMKSRSFDRRVKQHAKEYDRIRATTNAPDRRGGKSTVEHIRNLFVDRYATRFGKAFLGSLVEFYTSDLGTSYAKLNEDLEKELEAEAKRYDG